MDGDFALTVIQNKIKLLAVYFHWPHMTAIMGPDLQKILRFILRLS